MMRIQFHSHSCFSLYTQNGTHILIDPYLSGNPLADVTPQELHPDVVLITHGHDDHLGDAIYFAEQGALIIANFEIIQYLERKNLPRLHPMQIGGGYQFDFGYIKMLPAGHGSTIYDGASIIPAGSPAGFLLQLDDYTIYHAGDTGLIMDMELLGRYYNIDLAMLPIGGNFTMDIPDALRALELIKPSQVIPMHYDTFPLIRQNPTIFAQGCQNQNVTCHILKSGDILNF